MLDAVSLGAKTVEVAGVGVVKLGAQSVGWISGQLQSGREQAAAEAINRLNGDMTGWGATLTSESERFDPLPNYDAPPTPVPGLGYNLGGAYGGQGGSGVGGVPVG